MSSPLERVIAKLEAKRTATEWEARCPAHEDHRPSLRVNEGDVGQVLLWCHAGCTYKAIADAMHMQVTELWPAKPRKQPPLAEYDYRDANGSLRYQVVRWPGKDFKQRHQAPNGKWENHIRGIDRLLYRLPQLLAADPEQTVFICEGEKDVDALRALGLIATCNSGGAGKWRPEHAEHLRGRRVVTIPDHDDAGYEHATTVANSLFGIAAEVKILDLPDLAHKQDVSDWLNKGGNREELERLAQETEPLTPDTLHNLLNQQTADDYTQTATEPPIPLLLPRRKLMSVRATDVRERKVEWLWSGYIPLGSLTILDGDPGVSKTTIMFDIIARYTTGNKMPDGSAGRAPGVAIFASTEDDAETTLKPRLVAAGGNTDNVYFVEATKDETGTLIPVTIPADLSAFGDLIEETGASLLVFDPLVAFLGEEINSHHDQQVRRALAPLRTLIEKHRTGTVGTRHLTKDTSKQAIYRGGGSVGIIGQSRAALLAVIDPDDATQDPNDKRRIMVPIKNSQGRVGGAMSYYVRAHEYWTADDDAEVEHIKTSKIDWSDPVDMTGDQIIAAQAANSGPQPYARAQAKEFLATILANGPIPSEELDKAAKQAGITPSTLKRARRDLNIMAIKGTDAWADKWLVCLPEHAKLGREPDNVNNRMAAIIKPEKQPPH